MITELVVADTDSFLPTLGTDSIDTVITDPPYKVNIAAWDHALPKPAIWAECFRILKPGGHLVVFGQPSISYEFFASMKEAEKLSEFSFSYRDTFIWAYQGTHTKGFKLADGSFRSRIRNIYNPIYIFRKSIEGTEEENWNKWHTNLLNIDSIRQPYNGDHKHIVKKFKETGEAHLQAKKPSNTFKAMERKGWVPNDKGAEPTNIQYCPRITKAERTINSQIENEHETVKPLSIMLWLVNMFTSDPNQIVLDIYSGTGTTGMACKLLDRNFVGIDSDPAMETLSRFRIEHVEELDNKLFKRTPVGGSSLVFEDNYEE